MVQELESIVGSSKGNVFELHVFEQRPHDQSVSNSEGGQMSL